MSDKKSHLLKMPEGFDLSSCEGCHDYELAKKHNYYEIPCDIVFSHIQLFDQCPCKTCLVKVMCHEACEKWKDLVYKQLKRRKDGNKDKVTNISCKRQ